MAHTPGPWKIDQRADIYITHDIESTRVNGYSPALAVVLTGGERITDTQTANARLIAAAPDLYAVLRAAYDELENGPLSLETIGAMNDVLAKADGK